MILDSTGRPFPAAAVPRPMAFSPWMATQLNAQRKQLWTFDSDPGQHLTSAARRELDLLAQTLYKNSGLASAAKNIFRLVGSLKPQAKTGNTEYDLKLEEAFRRVAESPLIFDAAGEETFYSYQLLITQERLVRGDLFSVFTETTTGAARIAARGAHTVGGSPDGDKSGTWYDGIRTDSNGMSTHYYFPGSRRGASRQIPPQTLDRADVFHHRNPHGMGTKRGVTAFAHAINHIRDIIEITAAQKQSIKTAAEVAVTRKQDAEHNVQPSSLGLNSPVQTDAFTPPDYIGEPPPEASLPVQFEAFVQSGIMSNVPLDILHDERPHPNALAFREELKREIANGFGVPPQIFYFIDDPGGAWSRILLEALVFFIAEQHFHLRQFCQRFWVYAISKEIKSGRLDPFPKTVRPENMWRVRWMPPRSMTADIAKIGRLTIDMRRTLLTTFAKHYEELGLDWEEELQQTADELAYCKKLERETPGLEPGDLTGWIYGPGQGPVQAGGNPGQQHGGSDHASALSALAEQVAALTELVTSELRKPAH